MKGRNKLLLSGLIGAAVGSAVTALTTPRSGEESRRMLKKAPEKTKDTFYEKLDDAGLKKQESFTEKMKRKAHEAAEDHDED